MWSIIDNNFAKMRFETTLETLFVGIVYMSLDCGITWDSGGRKYPSHSSWKWCHPDKTVILNYIDKLLSHKILPILYSEGANIDVIEKIIEPLNFKPPVFIQLKLENIHLFVTSNTFSKYYKVECTDAQIYHIGPPAAIGKTYTNENLGFDPLNTFDWKTPHLLILVGQPGSGKSVISTRLNEKGWYIVDERYALSIQRSIDIKDSKVITKFKSLLSNIGKDPTLPGYYGVIIDSSNPQKIQRQCYINMAISENIEYKVGWITRPGYYYNDQIPSEVLDSYSVNFEHPIAPENWFRLV